MASEQAEITRNMPMKIALNLPKSLFTQKMLVIMLFVRCSTVTVRNDRLSQPHKTEDVDAIV